MSSFSGINNANNANNVMNYTDVADDASPDIPLKNPEGYTDHTAYRALKNVMQPETVWRDPADHRHWRLIKTLMNLIDLMGYDLIGRIEVYDRQSGRTYH